MSIGTPNTLLAGSGTGILSGSATGVATGTAPAGSLLVCCIMTNSDADSITAFSDTAGNVYTIYGVAGGTSYAGLYFCYCLNSSAPITTSTTWTATTALGGSNHWLQHGMYSVSGAGLAAEGGSASGTSTGATSASVSTGTLASNNVIAFGQILLNPQGAGGGSVVVGGGWTALFTYAAYSNAGYLIQSSSFSSISYTPTWNTNSGYSIIILAFDATLNPPLLSAKSVVFM
jgi:hypothetical protein